ncbi:MAG TPA: response regulator [Nitrososphaera sp.]|jgi:CheY-like chemotaxis protein|nr:response regulator [Nitrososphaera sp.]
MHDMNNVLIVDDNQYLREILATMLRFSGYEISQAANGSEALKMAVSAKPNVILLDIQLPDMKGADVARAIRTQSASAHIPIIGCSAFLGGHWRQQALHAGMVDYLEKPIPLEVIQAKIKEFILSES